MSASSVYNEKRFTTEEYQERYYQSLEDIQRRVNEVRNGLGACCYNNTSRGCRNFSRVTLATTGSGLGVLFGGYSGFILAAGAVTAVTLSVIFAGGANGCSSIFAYETDSEDRDRDLERVVAQLAREVDLLREEIDAYKSEGAGYKAAIAEFEAELQELRSTSPCPSPASIEES